MACMRERDEARRYGLWSIYALWTGGAVPSQSPRTRLHHIVTARSRVLLCTDSTTATYRMDRVP